MLQRVPHLLLVRSISRVSNDIPSDNLFTFRAATALGLTGGAPSPPFPPFGGPKKPDTPTATPALATSTTTPPAPLFGGGTSGSFAKPAVPDATKDKEKEKDAEKGKDGAATASGPSAGANLFSAFSAKKPDEPAKPSSESELFGVKLLISVN
jgi:hypothetical protein